MKFIYDSLDTVRKLKYPTKKDFITLTIGIFALVIVTGVFFIFADSILSTAYKLFHKFMS